MNNVENSFSETNYTEQIVAYISELENRIYDIEDHVSSLDDNVTAIISYLNSVHSTLPLGMAIRRHLCGRFGKKTDKGYDFVLPDGSKVSTSDFLRPDYDMQSDDIKEYTSVFWDVYQRFNPEVQIPKFTVAEARRLLRSESNCRRDKMFDISFALHVNPAEMNKFLTDVLALQSYNMRNPKEIIAFFCHAHEEYNSYAEYLRLVTIYESKKKTSVVKDKRNSSYTLYVTTQVREKISTESELFDFLEKNQADFEGASQTAYKEFRAMYDKICEKVTYRRPTNDDYLSDATFSNANERTAFIERVNRSVAWKKIDNSPALAKKLGVPFVGNPEQLAYAMMSFIPRATFERHQGGRTIISTDFISISNGEAGQNSRRVQTTTLPKDITMNLLMRDRLDDLLVQLKPVERKDLVFMKYFLFSLYLQEKGEYTYADYLVFIEECNDMLVRCGMSRLYAANRFENLIMLSLLAESPFEMFEDIIENSFINEPAPESADEE